MEKALVHIYTGDGKGKTTSAAGLAVRALGHGKKVCYSYFNKKPGKFGYTEKESLEKLGAKVIGLTNEHPFFNKSISKEVHQKLTLEGFEDLKKFIINEDFDMLVIDEILISVRDHFLEESLLMDFIRNKPAKLELVLTGRGATDGLIELADYVSRIEKVKHPMDNGTMARKGIEF